MAAISTIWVLPFWFLRPPTIGLTLPFQPTTMPYVDLYSQPNYASIFYMTNSQFNNVGGFCPNKPTAVILHPSFLDSTWLAFQFADPRLSGPYNLIAFDMRSCGQSSCRLDARHDSWVDAADLALCFQVCQVPNRLGKKEQKLNPGLEVTSFTESYSCFRSHIRELCSTVCCFVRYFSSVSELDFNKRIRFPEMCLSLTLVNVPSPMA